MYRFEAGNGSVTATGSQVLVKRGDSPPYSLPVAWLRRRVIAVALAGFDLISCRQGLCHYALMIKRAGQGLPSWLIPCLKCVCTVGVNERV